MTCPKSHSSGMVNENPCVSGSRTQASGCPSYRPLGVRKADSPFGGLVLCLKHCLPLSSFQDLDISFSQLTEGVLLKPAQKRSSLEKDK